ncbi:hypothetical protein NECAME_15321, partial [Necator americanus]
VLALNYGADVCYTEEIVDQKLLSSKRVVNNTLGTIDYCILDDIVLRIAPSREQKRCILQIGTNNGCSAAQVAKIIGTDVSGIDVNMGCPKPFSVHSGMGAALLTRLDRIKEQSETLNLVREIEKCGVAAIGVHGRRKDERDPHPCRLNEIREIARTVSIPVIAK